MIRPSHSRRAALGAFAVLFIGMPAVAQVVQQTGGPAAGAAADPTRKKALTIDEYSRWRQIEGSQISGDGRYVAYVLRQTNVPTANSKPVLHILRLDDNQDVTVVNASQPTFSPDSRWVTYQIEPPPRPANGRGRGGAPGDSATADTTGGRGRGATPEQQRRMELRELATGKVQSWQNMATATFSATSSHVLLRRSATPAAGGRGGAPGGPPPAAPGGATPPAGSGVQTATPRGSDAILHNLATGRYVFIGSVGDAAFNRKGEMLAYTVDAALRDANGVFAVELATGRTLPLDNDARAYNRMTWNDEGNAVAVLKGIETPRMRERANALLVIANIRAGFDNPSALRSTTLDATTAPGFPKGFVVSDRATLSWSDDDNRVFFGIIPQTPAPDTARRRSADSVPDVDVWRTADERIQSLQMIRADAERNFTFRQAFDVSARKYVSLTDSSMRDIEIALDGKWAVGRDARAYVSDYERPRADFYRVNTATGERTLMLKAQLTQGSSGISPDGRHFMFWKDNRYQDYDLETGRLAALGADAPSFVSTEWDHPGPRPPFGGPIYTTDGRHVVVPHRFDLWLLPLDPSAPARVLTNGLGNRGQVEFRYLRTEPIDPTAPRAVRDAARMIDLSKPVTLTAYGDRTKKAGFYELSGNTMKELVYDDALYGSPVRAAKADRFLLTRQTFAEYPDLRVAGPSFAGSRKITDANPQQSEYLWGKRVLFDYKVKGGRTLQGILAVPDDYRQGEKRPMIVSFYEKNSQNMHRYTAPSFVTGMGALPVEAVTKGYLTMMPDVHFNTGSSHSDMLEAVEAATRKVIEMGYADPKKIAVHGHSYGGEGAAFIGTRSKMFAAVGVGAGVSDLYSDFMQPWGWTYQVNAGSGANAFDYYLYGQGRWGFTPWEKPEVYRYESAITHAPNAAQPILIMHGTADPTVSFMEGLNLYQALRYNKKEAVLLAYPGEGHGLRGLANRRDLTIRYFEFFDHYLKGTPAPKWMTQGVPFLVKEAQLSTPATPRPIVP